MAKRALGALLVAPFVLIFGALVFFIFSAIGTEPDHAQPPPVPPEIVSKYSGRLDTLDVEAIEAAYKTQIEHLFASWMQDATGQPARAVNGAINARQAFFGAMNEIETRQGLRQQKGTPK
jgi:hypothetical protein